MFRRRPPLPPFPTGALLVGGAARDWLRGVAPKDFDWAVPNPENAARELAVSTGGSAFPLDLERGYWRVSAAGGIQHDLVPLPDEVNADLLRRDFTVNALALDAAHRVLDPAGGQGDLRAKRIRMVSEANLRVDPLRAWRATRFEVTLGFKMEAQTEAVIRHVITDLTTGLLPFPAWERVRDEVHALLRHREAALGIQRLHDLGLLALTIPELLEGLGLELGGFHHLDVFHHNLEALHQLIARNPEASVPLRWAALLHDVGKPRCLALDPETGRRSFHGHDKLGANLTVDILTRLKLPGDDIRHASKLVGAHMIQLPAGEKEARRFVHRRREILPDLLYVMLADREAARGPMSTPATRHAYAVAMNRVLEALEVQPAAPKPLLSGAQIMALLNLKPGPLVGQAVRALNEAVAVGDVLDEAEAQVYLLRWREMGIGR